MFRIPGTAGYHEAADQIVRQYEAIAFTDVHAKTLPFFPPPPARIADIGAGSGRDAAALAKLGHAVVAVEPTAELMALARSLHGDVGISWIGDALPHLDQLTGQFDLVLITAVWMHLSPRERRQGMRRVASLIACGGRLAMTLRHGPVPCGRHMYDVSAAETIGLAEENDLWLIHVDDAADLQERPGVSWSSIVMQKVGAASTAAS
ncbi:class I SAM-dependent methyltransferase [Streptomyces virginiae]|uniref:class I SAM-dependent methyltransferase n=1 Tax=Streptomyces TaxID=1883 RepID=UPI00343F4C84